MGIPVNHAVNSDSLLNPQSLQYFIEFQKLIESGDVLL